MNRGLIVGRTFSKGVGVAGVNVFIRRITTSGGLLEVAINDEAVSKSKGKFAIPFNWYGDQFADELLWIDILLIAVRKHRTSALSSWDETGKTAVRGYLIKDAGSLMGVPLTSLVDAVGEQNSADLLTFITDFKEHWGKMSVVLGRYRTDVLSTESTMIIGAGNIFVK